MKVRRRTVGRCRDGSRVLVEDHDGYSRVLAVIDDVRTVMAEGCGHEEAVAKAVGLVAGGELARAFRRAVRREF